MPPLSERSALTRRYNLNVDALNALVEAIEAQTSALAENTTAVWALNEKLDRMNFDANGRLLVKDGLL